MLKLETQKRKVRVGFYPYTYVRTAVMKSLLFKRADYEKMLKMSFSEIAKFLQESHYKKEINQLATEYGGAELLELALNKNLAESFRKLIRISSEELALLVKEYSLRKDIEDLKTVLRGKFTSVDAKIVSESITGTGTMGHEFFMSLLKKDSIEEILKHNGIADFGLLKNSAESFKSNKNLMAIENALDKYYYNRLIEFSSLLSGEGNLFRNFIMKEVEVLNLLMILRLKKAKLAPKEIMEFLILSDNQNPRILNLANLESIDDIAKALSKTEYGIIVAKGIEDYRKTGSLIKLETMLYKHFLNQSMLFTHQNPLSVDVILGYMFAKDIEARNLKIIVKGKQLGLSEEFIENQLVFE